MEKKKKTHTYPKGGKNNSTIKQNVLGVRNKLDWTDSSLCAVSSGSQILHNHH